MRNVFSFCLLLVLTAAVAAQQPQRHTISVSGNSEIRVAPDEVMLNVGVEAFDLVLNTAKKKADAAIRGGLAVAKRHGVPDAHVQTEYISIDPEYHMVGDRRQLTGYEVRRALSIRLREISKFEALLTDLMQAGVNVVRSVEFRTTELRKHRDEARRLAMVAAREKAEALASHAGRKLGPAISISENSSGAWSAYNWWWGGQNYAFQNVVQVSGGSAAPEGSLAPGQITVNATISVTYELQ